MAKDVTYQKYKTQRRSPQPGFRLPELGRYSWVVALVAVNIAVVVYHGDPRDRMAKASALEPEAAQAVPAVEVVETEADTALVGPVLAQAPTKPAQPEPVALQSAPAQKPADAPAVVEEVAEEEIAPKESTMDALARLSETYNPATALVLSLIHI